MKCTYDPHDVNCFHGLEGQRFILEWDTEEDGQFGPESLRYIETEVSPMYNGGYTLLVIAEGSLIFNISKEAVEF